MNFENLNFLKISEKAAISVYPMIGMCDKYKADDLATQSMREELNKMNISAKVVIGEGEMDEAPMLYIGEELGSGGYELDIAVDPLDGTTLTSKGQNNAITVIAFSDKGSFLNAPDMYMKKICVGSKFKGHLDISKSLTENIKKYIFITGKNPQDITVAMLDRERHIQYIQEVIDLGCKLLLLSDGDILPGILTGLDQFNIDFLYGVGAAPEGVITAAALKALGGDFQGVLVPETEEQKNRCISMGISNPETHIFKINNLVKSENIEVVISAVTNGFIGDGVVRISKNQFIVNSLRITNTQPNAQFIRSFYEK